MDLSHCTGGKKSLQPSKHNGYRIYDQIAVEIEEILVPAIFSILPFSFRVFLIGFIQSIKNLCSFWIIRTEYATMIIYGYPIRSIHLLISKQNNIQHICFICIGIRYLCEC